MPISFYLVCLVSNVILIALYTVQVLTPHQTCIVNGVEITHQYDLAFRLGFAILIADFLSTNVVSLYVSFTDETPIHGSKQNGRQSIIANFSLDWPIKGLTLLISGFQYQVISS